VKCWAGARTRLARRPRPTPPLLREVGDQAIPSASVAPGRPEYTYQVAAVPVRADDARAYVPAVDVAPCRWSSVRGRRWCRSRCWLHQVATLRRRRPPARPRAWWAHRANARGRPREPGRRPSGARGMARRSARRSPADRGPAPRCRGRGVAAPPGPPIRSATIAPRAPRSEHESPRIRNDRRLSRRSQALVPETERRSGAIAAIRANEKAPLCSAFRRWS
jgi:hypothetical protein